MSQEYRLSLQEKQEQAFGFIAGAVRERLEKGKPSVIALSSSGTPRRIQSAAAVKLAERLSRQKKCLLVKLELSAEGKSSGWKEEGSCLTGTNVPAEQLKALLEEKKAQFDAVVLDIPPVMWFSEALEYARTADQLYLLERYRYTLYSHYEKTMALLRDSGLQVSGVIACR